KAEGRLQLARHAARPPALHVDVDPVGERFEDGGAVGAVHRIAAVRAHAPEVLHPGADGEALPRPGGTGHRERRAANEPHPAGALGWLAAPDDAPPPAAAARLAAVHLIDPGGRALLPVHAPHAAAVAAHARRALRAAAAFRRGPPGAGVVRACRVAAALWNEG